MQAEAGCQRRSRPNGQTAGIEGHVWPESCENRVRMRRWRCSATPTFFSAAAPLCASRCSSASRPARSQVPRPRLVQDSSQTPPALSHLLPTSPAT